MISPVAFRVYELYRQLIENNGGTYERSPSYHERIWEACAKAINELRMDTEMFVTAQFAVVNERARKTIQPATFFKSRVAAVKNYKKLVAEEGPPAVGNSTEVAQNAVRCHLLSMECLLDRLTKRTVPHRYRSQTEVLLESCFSFTSWFRVLVAPELTQELADRYLLEAQAQVMHDVHLTRLLESDHVTARYDAKRIIVW